MQNVLAEISLGAIVRNAEKIASRIPLIAVVKDDAYGHGAVPVSLALHKIASMFAVATVEEGVALRIAGVEEDILVLSPALCSAEGERMAAYGLTASLTSAASLNVLKGARGLTAHLAVNTGMNRYGFRPERVAAGCRAAAEAGIAVTGVFSHLYAPASPQDRDEQLPLFRRAAERVRKFYPGAIRHLSATGGFLAGECFDAVRAGIALYGYLPEGFENVYGFEPAAKVYATVSHACTQVGHGAGYGRAEGPDLYTLRAGYGDGLFRAGLRGGAGELCMDAAVCRGKGRFGGRKLLPCPADYARAHGTSVYEALLRLLRRAEKVYI